MNYASVAFESLLRLDRTREREAPRYKCSRKLEVVARVTMGKIFCLVCTVLLDIRANGTQLLGWLELGFNAAGNWFFSVRHNPHPWRFLLPTCWWRTMILCAY